MINNLALKSRILKIVKKTKMKRSTKRFIQLFAVAVLLILTIVVLPYFLANDPIKVNLGDRLKSPFSVMKDGSVAIFGTDELGRDVLARVLYGGRISILISFCSVIVAGVIGLIFGVIAGYYGGVIDEVLMRICDIQLAFPTILLALAITAILGPSIPNLIITMGFTRWVGYARIVRGSVLSAREEDYVKSAICLGIPSYRIMIRHILPNVISPIIILAALHLGQIILQESALSFLGLGIQPPTPSWGGMIGDGREYLNVAWWSSTIPGLAIALSVVIFGSLGDAVRDMLDPKFSENNI